MTAAAELFRPGLLNGVRVAIAELGGGGSAQACRQTLAELGAALTEEADAQSDVLVVDAPAAHGELLAPTLTETWSRVHGYAGDLIEAARGGRVLLVAPADDAAAAALENLARTLSVEWARREITVVAIARGDGAASEDVARLVAFLSSEAGAYFSGCLLDLRGS